MANTKIKDVTAKTTVVATDEIIINDVAGGNTDKKEGMDDIRTFMLPTNAETKTAYEANADTNEFSDSEQTNLANQSGTNTGDESDSSATVKGIVELATITEVNTGTDATRAVTPDSLEGSALQIKVDAIEASADVTDATNVNAAGATMNADTDVSGNGYVVDEDNMASDLNTKVPTQQSVKAYVDANSGGLANVVEDTTPQLGGDLDAQAKDIDNVKDFTMDNNAAHVVSIERNAAITDDNVIGQIDFKAHEDVGGTPVLGTYGSMIVTVEDETQATEDASFKFNAYTGGTLGTWMKYNDASDATINLLKNTKVLQINITGGYRIGTQFALRVFDDQMMGAVVDPRWTFTQVVGTPTIATTDGLNEGYTITGGNANDFGVLGCADKRNFSPTASTFYTGIEINPGHDNNACYVGLSDTIADPPNSTSDSVAMEVVSGNVNVQLRSTDGTTGSSTSTGVAMVSGELHLWRVIIDSTNLRVWELVNGEYVIKVTKTTNRPAQNLQPFFSWKAATTAGNATCLLFRAEAN